MGNDIPDSIRVVAYVEVETPIPVDAGLPEIAGFIILFGAKRWVPQVVLEELHLLKEVRRTSAGASARAFSACGT
jgi:hypothetical protein